MVNDPRLVPHLVEQRVREEDGTDDEAPAWRPDLHDWTLETALLADIQDRLATLPAQVLGGKVDKRMLARRPMSLFERELEKAEHQERMNVQDYLSGMLLGNRPDPEE